MLTGAESYLVAFWSLLSEVAPYLLAGVVLAAFLRRKIAEERVRGQLGGDSVGAVFRAVAWGIPLPLCSCSVIPFATAMRRAGASRASTLSFLIATPITGIDSLAATYGVFGWFFTLYRLVASVVTAVVAGVLMWVADRKEKPQGRFRFTARPTAASNVLSMSAGAVNVGAECRGDACCSSRKSVEPPVGIWGEAEEIFADFAGSLLIGLLLGAAIQTWVPGDLLGGSGENPWWGYGLVLLVSGALYLCATSSIPLGAALLGSGLSPGAVFILLSAGPAMSLMTVSVLKKLLGWRALGIYLASVLGVSLFFGWALDRLFAAMVHEADRALPALAEEGGILSGVAAAVLLGMTVRVLFRSKSSCGC